MDHILLQLAMFLAVAAFAAPAARMFGLGSVLGYVVAGALIGPYGPLAFILGYSPYQADIILHSSELGIAFFLFLIGLELRPKRLWSMRESVFLAGGAQVLITAVLLVGVIWLMSENDTTTWSSLRQTLLIGFALALSSTAFALQTMDEKGELTARHGRLAFSILLFQDIAAIPIIALIPVFLVGLQAANGMDFAGAVRVLAAMAAIIIVGRYLLNHLFKIVASTGMREAMTATALLTVVSVALLMSMIGMSAALGAFLAGVLLATSPYRHQLQSEIRPFEMLLLGVFFTAIGMSLNLNTFVSQPENVIAGVTGLFLAKGAVLYAIGRWQGLDHMSSRRLAIILAQGGEFAFVIFTAARPFGILSREDTEILTLIVIVSMLLTPLLLKLDDYFLSLRQRDEPAFDTPPENEGHVIIAGFGRVGQTVSQVLGAKRIPFTALDKDPEKVAVVNESGGRIYYGDASRLSMLEAADTHKARAFVVAVDNVETSLKTAQLVRRYFPHVPIYARARNHRHAHQLKDIGVTYIERGTLLASLELTRDLLRGLGVSSGDVRLLELEQMFAKDWPAGAQAEAGPREIKDESVREAKDEGAKSISQPIIVPG